MSGTPAGSNPQRFVQVGDVQFFTAFTQEYGQELWKTDGTVAGTVLVKDVTPGGTSSSIFQLVPFGDLLYFSVGDHLWKSDGTTAGTVLVKDVPSDDDGLTTPLGDMAGVNGVLFFSGSDPAHGTELWRSDGTEAGTYLLKDIQPGPTNTDPRSFVAFNGAIYFIAVDSVNGTELWTSDGTAAGTVLVKDIKPGGNGAFFLSAPNFLVSGATLYFTADDGTNGLELWKTDGTTAGTTLVKDISPGPLGSIGAMADLNGTPYFWADDGTNGQELWKSDGTLAGTMLVKDINPGGASTPSALRKIGGALYFLADDGTNGQELWKSDGTAAGTSLVKDIRVGPASAGPGALADLDGSVLLTVDDGAQGRELWISDGTAAGTTLVEDIRVGASSSSISLPGFRDDAIAFAADDGVNGIELWVTDGTTAGTELVDLDPGFQNAFFPDSVPAEPGPLGADLGGDLIFSSGATGTSFTVSDGTLAGTTSVSYGLDFDTPIRVAGGNAYFGAFYSGGGDAVGMFRTDGTFGGTYTLDTGRVFGINDMLSMGGVVYYAEGKYASLRGALRRTNGSIAGTFLLADFGLFRAAGSLVNANGTLFLEVNDTNLGGSSEIWKSNGTAAGTVLVTTLPKTEDNFSGRARQMVAIGSNVFFLRSDGANWGLWKCDGTAAGTSLVKTVADFQPFVFRSAWDLTDVNGTLFFVVEESILGRLHLWKSDGTTAGTVFVKDIGATSAENGQMTNLINVDGRLFFFAEDGINGYELWTSDGSDAGTILVKDIFPGPGDSFEQLSALNFGIAQVAVGDFLYFSVKDGVSGYEVWRSDGTPSGTVRFADVVPGPSGSRPGNFVVAATNLFFRPDTLSSTTLELWRIANATTCGNGVVNGTEACDDADDDNGDGCTIACTVTSCGDGFVTGAETCDDGNAIDTDACPSSCATATCGDGVVQANIEACDDGNATNGDGCDTNCELTGCGNGSVSAGEECDDGTGNGVGPCSLGCTLCGNGIAGAGEECDDGNASDVDGCTNRCTVCGNGAVGSGEECDDGGLANGDGCDANCQVTGCGNGIVTAGEQCDDSNRFGDDCCDSSCQLDGLGDPCASDGNQCTSDICNGSGSCTHANAAGPCDDGIFCNGGDTCGAGSCTVHAGNPCVGGSECADVCNETADNCFVASGTACTGDGNVCTDDECDGAGVCGHPNNTAACDDGVFCNGSDICGGGNCLHAGDPCVGGPSCLTTCNEGTSDCFDPIGTDCANPLDVCEHGICDGAGSCDAALVPATTCLEGEKTQLSLRHDAGDTSKDKLGFKWSKGPAIGLPQLGDPTALDGYTLCVYDAVGLVLRADVPSGGICLGGVPCWAGKGAGYKFKDKGAASGGVTGITLKAGDALKTKAIVKGGGGNLGDAPIPLVEPVTSQLFRADGSLCIGGEFSGTHVLLNADGQFKAKVP